MCLWDVKSCSVYVSTLLHQRYTNEVAYQGTGAFLSPIDGMDHSVFAVELHAIIVWARPRLVVRLQVTSLRQVVSTSITITP